MKEIKKILLGNKDVITKEIEDLFLNIELTRDYNRIKKNKINNNFNLSNLYLEERRNSLKFCVYGTVNTRIDDTEDLFININTDDNDRMMSPKINAPNGFTATTYTIKTIPLSINGSLNRNIYGKKKTSYMFLFEIDRNDLNKWIETTKASGNIPETKNLILSVSKGSLNDTLSVPFIFFDSDGEFIEYGTETADLDLNGNVIELNNDFPFFYDRHWIKANFNIERQRRVSFDFDSIRVPEEIGDITINFSLDFPSKHGLEEVTIDMTSSNLISNPNPDVDTSFPILPPIKWNVGEQNKEVIISIHDDDILELEEDFTIGFINMVNVDKGSIPEVKIIIEDTDLPKEKIININIPAFKSGTDPFANQPINAPVPKAAGIFRLIGQTIGDSIEELNPNIGLVWEILKDDFQNTSISTERQRREISFTDSLEYTIDVINKGEVIRDYKGKKIEPEETIISHTIFGGFGDKKDNIVNNDGSINLQLPTNYDFDPSINSYKKIKYELVIKLTNDFGIQRIEQNPYQGEIYEDIILPIDIDYSFNSGINQNTYMLASTLNNVRTTNNVANQCVGNIPEEEFLSPPSPARKMFGHNPVEIFMVGTVFLPTINSRHNLRKIMNGNDFGVLVGNLDPIVSNRFFIKEEDKNNLVINCNAGESTDANPVLPVYDLNAFSIPRF